MVCGKYGGENKFIQGCGRKIQGKASTWKTEGQLAE